MFRNKLLKEKINSQYDGTEENPLFTNRTTMNQKKFMATKK
jgi:hypothetical protein